MNIEGTIAQCKSLLLQGKQVNAEKVDSPIEAASTFSEKIFSDCAFIELPKQYKRKLNERKTSSE